MNNHSHAFLVRRLQRWTPLSLLLAAVAALVAPGLHGWPYARAAATDVSTVPVFAAVPPSVNIKPNIMFIMDDSGSMDWDYMPDEASAFDQNRSGSPKFGHVSSHCNGVYYNPSIKYTPPVYADGTSYPDSTFSSAKRDGYGLTSGSVNLGVSFKAWSGDTEQKAYYYRYKGTQTSEAQKQYTNTESVFYKECNSLRTSTTKHDGTNAVNTLFEYVEVGASEQTNFANWYTYYRTRMNTMKTAAGLAFKSLDDDYRVGFMTINDNVAPGFLNIQDFSTTQRTEFYKQLYESKPDNGTPLRSSLSKVGRMYANKITSINGVTVVDPVQYACQQNYTILSTDGKWNTDSASDVLAIDGSTQVGNADGGLPRPYNDGSKVTTTIVTPYISTQDRTTTTTAGTATKTWRRNNTVIGASCTAAVPPSGTAAAPLDVSNPTRNAALFSTDRSSTGNVCASLATGVWMCRSTGSSSLATGGAASLTSSGGVTWYLANNFSGNTGCRSARDIFPAVGGITFYNNVGACPSQGGVGSLVTVTPETLTESITSYRSDVTDRYTATQTTTQVINDGVPGSVGPLAPATPSYAIDSTVAQIVTEGNGGAARTCGGVAVAYPTTCEASGLGVWTAGTPTVNNVCVAAASVPAAGRTTAIMVNQAFSGAGGVTTTTAQVKDKEKGTEISTSVGSGGVANTLADVAAYYYATNLRTAALGNCTGPTIAPATTPNDLCLPNVVPPTDSDPATWQHMTTYTLGLGVRGLMAYAPNYAVSGGGSADFNHVAAGVTAAANTCSWRDTLTTDGNPCNWPVPSDNATANIDDLWHAGVNGRGNYFSASDPNTLASSLSSTLKSITNKPRAGTASAAATTNPKVTDANNFQFSTYFKSVEWSGELIRQPMNLEDGSVPEYDHMKPDPKAYDWSAKTKLDAKTYTDRVIYTQGATGLTPFTWDKLSSTQKTYFTAPHISTAPPAFPGVLTGLSQFCLVGTDCIAAAAQTNTTVASGGAAGEALVNFLRGDRANEEVGTTTDNTKFFRRRTGVLGDIVSAQPQYVGAPSRFYSDPGYAAFKVLHASRSPLVYAAANDGMLHAFSAATGEEVWAYVPGMLLPKLYTLADKKYSDKHQYFVEGTPVIGDFCPNAPTTPCNANEWRTMLVGGLNAGGTGYYALDITDPANPALLWEFSNPNMGWSFGKPQITKLTDGTWVVLLTSGYNNCPRTAAADRAKCVLDGTGDGQGYLYVLNAATGGQVTGSPIAAGSGVGSVSDPSGLAQIVAQADTNNVSRRVYAGDLFGNLWRFSIEPGSFSSHLLAVLKDSDGKVQPITVRPTVTTVNGRTVVYVGTGRYLGASDVGTTPKPKNSFYGIKDDFTTTTTYNNPRTYSSFVGQQAVPGLCPSSAPVTVCKPGQVVRTVFQTSGSAAADLTTQDGWYLDFPVTAGEIQFTDPRLVLGTLAFSTSVPTPGTTASCTAGKEGSDGDALGYMLDYLTGGAVGTTSGVIASNLGSGIATAPQIAQLPNGTVIAKYRLSTGQEVSVPLRFGASGGSVKRISWRELVSD